jgi:hypothetical protein
MRRGILATVAVMLAVTGSACDRGGEEPRATALYEARCSITIASFGGGEVQTLTEQGATQHDAEAAAWTAFCFQNQLPAGCENELPEGFSSQGVMCMTIGGTGLGLETPVHSCTLNIEDRRSIRRAEATVERTGSLEELETYDTDLCNEAVALACGDVGSGDDCTAGDEPGFQVVGRAASRRLTGTHPER